METNQTLIIDPVGYNELCKKIAAPVCNHCKQNEICPITQVNLHCYNKECCGQMFFLTFSCHNCSSSQQMLCACKYWKLDSNQKIEYVKQRFNINLQKK